MFAKKAPITERILLSGLKFHGFIGPSCSEKILGQRITVHLEVELNTPRVSLSGCIMKRKSIQETVCYSDVYKIVRDALESTPRKVYFCLEEAAEEIIQEILRFSEFTRGVKICIEKNHVKSPLTVSAFAVEMCEKRS